MPCQSGYKFPFDGYSADFDDVFVRKEFFSEGGLWVWGENAGAQASGVLGTNNIVSRSSPVQTVSGGTNWKQVSMGCCHTAGIKTDGTLWLMGYNSPAGVLGDNTRTNRSSPVQTVSGGTNWKQASSGRDHMGAIKTDGTLWVWGCGTNGRLGTNSVIDRSSPVQTVSGGTDWKVVEMGRVHSSAIKTDGTLWLWGTNTDGSLGTNTTINQSSPVQTISGGTDWKQVSLGAFFSTAIKTDGTLWLWGCNSAGKLGNDSTINTSSPVQTVSGGTNWKQVATSSDHTAAIKTDGTLWVWGNNDFGQLAINLVATRSSPVQTVSGGTNWKNIYAGGDQTFAIKTDGTLWVWGNGSRGEMGNNLALAQSSPVQTVSGGTNWKDADVGGSFGGGIREGCW